MNALQEKNKNVDRIYIILLSILLSLRFGMVGNNNPIFFFGILALILFCGKSEKNIFILWIGLSPFIGAYNLELGAKIPDIKFDQLIPIFILARIFMKRQDMKKVIGIGRIEVLMVLFSCAVILSIMVTSMGTRQNIRVYNDAFVFPFITFFIAKNLLNKDEDIVNFCDVIIIMGIVCGILAIYEFVSFEDALPTGQALIKTDLFVRANGPFSDPEPLGIILGTVFFGALFRRYATKDRGIIKGGVDLTAMFLSTAGIYCTLFRGIWLAFILAIFLQGLVRTRRPVLLALLALVTTLVILGSSMWKDIESSDMYESRLGRTNTMYSRIGAWKGGLEMFLDNPILGVGYFNFQEVFENNYSWITVEGVPAVPRPHNLFISVLAETGMIGIIIFLLLCANIISVPIRYLKNHREKFDREVAVFILSAITVYFVSSLTLNFTTQLDLPNKMFFVINGIIAGRVALLNGITEGRGSLSA
jgi:hypothetical protein